VLLNAWGKEVKWCRRQRVITPLRLGLALTATCASQRVETLADFHRGFNALFDTTLTYKAFYNQLAKPPFATFMGTMASRLIGEMTLKVLGFENGWCGMQIPVYCSVPHGHTLTTRLTQRLGLAMTGAIFDQPALTQGHPIISTGTIGTRERLPVHGILPEHGVSPPVRICSNRGIKLSHQGS
jgi:hypothetical protein